MNQYIYFSKFYDQIMGEKWYFLYYKFLKKCIKKYNINPKLIIEAACGTGRLSKYLYKEAKMIGFDRSAEMIKIAKERNREFAGKIKFRVGEMENFKPNKSGDMIVCIFDSLNYIDSLANLKKIFTNFSKMLHSNGFFIFDMNAELVFRGGKKPIRNVRNFDFANGKIVWKNYTYSKIWKAVIDVGEKIGNKFIWRREIHKEYFYDHKKIEKLLIESGFEVMGVFSDFSFQPLKEKNTRYFFVAKKNN